MGLSKVSWSLIRSMRLIDWRSLYFSLDSHFSSVSGLNIKQACFQATLGSVFQSFFFFFASPLNSPCFLSDAGTMKKKGSWMGINQTDRWLLFLRDRWMEIAWKPPSQTLSHSFPFATHDPRSRSGRLNARDRKDWLGCPSFKKPTDGWTWVKEKVWMYAFRFHGM